MKTFILFAATLLAVNALSVEEQWSNFKVSHGKVYQNIVEEKLRYQTFQDNLKTIVEHNAKYDAGLETYWMGVNQFADMTSTEFSNMLKLQKKNKPIIHGNLHVENLTAPTTIDWRQKGAVLAVKNQGNCGSCWAFSATGAIEGQYAIHRNQKNTLSEQQLLDCSGSYGNGNCDEGGDMVLAFKYVKDHGLVTESAYPYIGKQNTKCKINSGTNKVKGFVNVASNENSLKNALGTVGPVSVAIYAEPIQLYAGGIFKSSSCYNSASYLDHGVLAVGYGTSPSDYWIVKNSWGSSWGESGYFRLARNANQCGIALDASYPTL